MGIVVLPVTTEPAGSVEVNWTIVLEAGGATSTGTVVLLTMTEPAGSVVVISTTVLEGGGGC